MTQPAPGRPKAAERPLGGQERSDVGADISEAVINTQRMMCANVAQANQARNSPGPGPSVVLDWMPWNHTMGGNAVFNGLLGEGGTLYIDDGRPVPGLFDETLRNLREVSPTYYANAPSGYAALAAAMASRSWWRRAPLMLDQARSRACM